MFIHFTSNESERSDKIAFQGGAQPAAPTSQWEGTVRLGTDTTVAVPSDCEPGEYGIFVGLWDPGTGARFRLLGDDDGTMRYRIGTLVVKGRGQQVSEIALTLHETTPSSPGWNAGIEAVDFGPASTRGAFRCERKAETLVVTPLPNLGPFSIVLRPVDLGLTAAVASVIAVDADGNQLRHVPYDVTDGHIEFTTQRNDFAYVIRP